MERLTIDLSDAPQLQDARRRIDTVRDRTGRAATVAAAAAAGVVLFAPETAGPALLATSAATVGGLATLWLGQPPGHQRATTTALYLMPGLSLSVLLVAERLVAGIHWGEVLGAVVWTAATWLLRPARTARRMVSPAPAPVAAAGEVEAFDAAPTEHLHPVAAWWTQHAAGAKGAAPGTVLEEVTRTGEDSMTAVIRAAVPGEPVPDVSIRRLSALMDIPEDLIKVSPVPGRGAGVRRLSIGAAEKAADPAALWTSRIAPKGMPGAVLTGININGRPVDLKEH
ncbi:MULTISPECIES: hypothetical protein [Actinocorallia]|uniref:Uncharacterized protein n=2 Tax=Actinocorallia TaxID=58108 RepID=A0ABN3UTQ2_9ACTN